MTLCLTKLCIAVISCGNLPSCPVFEHAGKTSRGKVNKSDWKQIMYVDVIINFNEEREGIYGK